MLSFFHYHPPEFSLGFGEFDHAKNWAPREVAEGMVREEAPLFPVGREVARPEVIVAYDFKQGDP